MNQDMTVKILLLGKTGVGKSSFVNYLFDKELAQTGVGLPITQETTMYKSEVNGVDVEVYDTKGLEAKISSDMKESFLNDILKRNANNDFWNHYHSIFYCVSMGNPRLDPFEVQFLKDIRKHILQPINIILTHCDGKKSSQIEEMRTHIKTSLVDEDENFKCKITPVCSVRERKRLRTTEPFGREELFEHLFDQVWEDASAVMANKVVPMYKQAVKNLCDNISKYIQYEYKKFINPRKITDECRRILNAVPTDSMNREYEKDIEIILENLKDYREFIEAYYMALGKYDSKSRFQEIFDGIEKHMMSKFKCEKLEIKRYMLDKTNNLLGKIQLILQGEKLFKESCDVLLRKFYDDINEEETKTSLERDFNGINEQYRYHSTNSKKLNDALKQWANW